MDIDPSFKPKFICFLTRQQLAHNLIIMKRSVILDNL